jgi:hypothetical protein
MVLVVHGEDQIEAAEILGTHQARAEIADIDAALARRRDAARIGRIADMITRGFPPNR